MVGVCGWFGEQIARALVAPEACVCACVCVAATCAAPAIRTLVPPLHEQLRSSWPTHPPTLVLKTCWSVRVVCGSSARPTEVLPRLGISESRAPQVIELWHAWHNRGGDTAIWVTGRERSIVRGSPLGAEAIPTHGSVARSAMGQASNLIAAACTLALNCGATQPRQLICRHAAPSPCKQTSNDCPRHLQLQLHTHVHPLVLSGMFLHTRCCGVDGGAGGAVLLCLASRCAFFWPARELSDVLGRVLALRSSSVGQSQQVLCGLVAGRAALQLQPRLRPSSRRDLRPSRPPLASIHCTRHSRVGDVCVLGRRGCAVARSAHSASARARRIGRRCVLVGAGPRRMRLFAAHDAAAWLFSGEFINRQTAVHHQ